MRESDVNLERTSSQLQSRREKELATRQAEQDAAYQLLGMAAPSRRKPVQDAYKQFQRRNIGEEVRISEKEERSEKVGDEENNTPVDTFGKTHEQIYFEQKEQHSPHSVNVDVRTRTAYIDNRRVKFMKESSATWQLFYFFAQHPDMLFSWKQLESQIPQLKKEHIKAYTSIVMGNLRNLVEQDRSNPQIIKSISIHRKCRYVMDADVSLFSSLSNLSNGIDINKRHGLEWNRSLFHKVYMNIPEEGNISLQELVQKLNMSKQLVFEYISRMKKKLAKKDLTVISSYNRETRTVLYHIGSLKEKAFHDEQIVKERERLKLEKKKKVKSVPKTVFTDEEMDNVRQARLAAVNRRAKKGKEEIVITLPENNEEESIHHNTTPSQRRLEESFTNQYPNLLTYVMRKGVPYSEAPDVVQQIFIAAQERFDDSVQLDTLDQWIYGVASYVSKSYRHQWYVPYDKVSYKIDASRGNKNTKKPDDIVVSSESAETLLLALDQLRPLDKQIVMLYHVQEYSLAEIAERLSVPIDRVQHHLEEGMSVLKQNPNLVRYWSR